MTWERAEITDDLSRSVCVEDVERYRFAAAYVEGKRVVDLACGTGYGSDMLIKKGHAAVVHAFDASDEAIAIAARTYGGPALHFSPGRAERIPLPNASVDVAISMETFEHLTDPNAMLREFHRVLVEGGTLIISTPRNDGPSRLCPDNPHHVREYSSAEFREQLEAVFPSVEIWSQVTDYEDDAPVALRPDALLGGAARALVPRRLRKWLRRAAGSRGLAATASRITAGENERAAYQIGFCRSAIG